MVGSEVELPRDEKGCETGKEPSQNVCDSLVDVEIGKRFRYW